MNKYAIEDALATYKDTPMDEDLLIVREQIVIDAKEIAQGVYGDMISYPWHGHTEEDFFRLIRELQIMLRENVRTESDIGLLMAAYPAAFRNFYSMPIMVFKTDPGYERYGDGRHRIDAAAKLGVKIPVQVVEWVPKESITATEYVERNQLNGWKFQDGLYACDGGVK